MFVGAGLAGAGATKLGVAIGTAIAPGIGTAIGAIGGLVVGAVIGGVAGYGAVEGLDSLSNEDAITRQETGLDK
jgi:hypothetical protein